MMRTVAGVPKNKFKQHVRKFVTRVKFQRAIRPLEMTRTSKIARFTPRITFNGGNNHLSRKTLQVVRDPSKGLRSNNSSSGGRSNRYSNKVVKDVVCHLLDGKPRILGRPMRFGFVWVAEFFKCGIVAVTRTKCDVAAW